MPSILSNPLVDRCGERPKAQTRASTWEGHMIAQDRPIASRQWIVLLLVLGTLVIDGVDTQLLSLVAPLIMGEWGVDRASFGPAMSAALLGMALGAGAGGWLGDRVGRKTVLVAATLLF